MIVGGGDGGSFLDTGGRYDLANNRWTSMSTTNAPSPRERHTAIWADNVMVVWGGSEGESYFASGGLYEPVTNNWATMSIDGAPSGRENHTAIWTGGRMVVWGGNVPWDVDDGGRYCVCAAATYYPDGDGDGFGDEAAALQACVEPPGHVTEAGDCDDADVNVWATPAEVRDLLFADTQTLFWNAPTEPGATTVLYDTIRSDTSSDFVTAPTCVDSNSPSTSSTDPVQLASGAVVFYLVRAENDCPDGLGSLGTDSLGVPRTGSNCP